MDGMRLVEVLSQLMDSQKEAGKMMCFKDQSCGLVQNISLEAFHYLQLRQYGQQHRHDPSPLFAEYTSHQVPGLLHEHEFDMGTMNKIFASKWLNDKQLVFGTKCNQLIVMDVCSGQQTVIPSLKSSEESIPATSPCGIHAIAINPSGTMLATGALHTNDIAVYRLPTFDPICVGEGGHTDWVFDMEWIDDEFIVTDKRNIECCFNVLSLLRKPWYGSRDSRLALWRVDEMDEHKTSPMTSLYIPEYAIKKPLFSKTCEKAVKVRALSINHTKKEMAVLSLNAYFQLWDIETFTQIWNTRMSCARENVCMAVSEEKNCYAVGSHSFVTLVDSRKKGCQSISARPRERSFIQGIRSLSFRKDIITIGTGVGVVMFYDLRADRYLESPCGHSCQLFVGNGWLRHDENYRDIFFDNVYPNAIYTHAYDDTGVRLFTAGGPLPAGLWGNYAALWA